VSNKTVTFWSLSLLLVLAACGEIQTTDQSNQPTGDISELSLPSPEAQLQETLAGTLNGLNVAEKAGAAKGFNIFADVLDQDETVTQIRVCADSVVDSLQLTTNKKVWPKRGGNGGACDDVTLNAGESIMRIRGTADGTIRSMAIDTTQGRQLGPWGNVNSGAGFDMVVYGGTNGRFRGWRGITGDASGITAVNQLTVLQQGMGGAGGAPWIDRLQDDEKLTALKICWRPNGYVTSVQMTTNVAVKTAHGGVASDQQCDTSELQADEYPVEIFGRASNYVHAVGYKTNLGRRIGPFGGTGGNGFSQSIGDAQRFYGIYGRAGSWIDAIGFVEPMANPASNYRGFQDNLPAGKIINAIELCTGENYGSKVIRSIQVFHSGNVGLPRHGARTNTAGLTCERVTLMPFESISAMSGNYFGVLSNVKFTTNQGRQFGPFGGAPRGQEFAIQNPWPSFLGFAGNASQAGNADKGTIVTLDFATPATFGQVGTPGASAAKNGWWETPATWPIVGVHAAVLTDGRVLTYGTDQGAAQGAQFTFDIWNPKMGNGASSHQTLPNNLGVDMFCSGQSLLPNGKLVLAGGDMRDQGYNNGIKNTTLFNPSSNQLEASATLNQARWYNSQKVLANGKVITLGGSNELGAASTTPEVFDGTKWTPLTGATSADAFNGTYIRSFVTQSLYPNGAALWVIATNGSGSINGKIYRLETTGNNGTGELIDSGVRLPGYYSWDRPVVQIASNKVLVQLNDGATVIVNLPNNGNAESIPSIENAGMLSQPRPWSEMLVLPTGDVLTVNGSRSSNQLVDVAYHAEMWSPSTKTWRKISSQLRPRLYHSTSILLADGRVMAIGGGSPAPTLEMNAQAFRPPYLFNAAGGASDRPTAAPGNYFKYGSKPTFAVSGGATRATLVRLGATSHSYNSEQSFTELTAARSGNNMTVTIPSRASRLPPGAYFFSVIDGAGVPSESKIVTVGN
jgi:hypothetical protein